MLIRLLTTVDTSGGHPPSYLYRILSEYYHPEDVDALERE